MLTYWQLKERRQDRATEKKFCQPEKGWQNYYSVSEKAYLYRNLRMLIFGVFSKGLSISSTLAIWL